MQYATIVVGTYTGTQQEYTYRVPPALAPTLVVGQVVLVPFRNRTVRGVVLSLETETEHANLKTIARIVAEIKPLAPWQLVLAHWMREYYRASLARCLATIHPFVFGKKMTLPRAKYIVPAAPLPKAGTLSTKQHAALAVVQHQLPRRYTINQLVTQWELSRSSINALLKKGFLQIEEEAAAPPLPARTEPQVHLTATAAQQAAIAAIDRAVEGGQNATFLLHGVTGSGKTEVYLQTMDTLIRSGRQAIMLIPEIALTPQTIARFTARFPGKVGLWHSKLNPTERYQTFCGIESGEIAIVVGSRSALFLPFPELGLICIDEEHEISYKQEQTPRYDARAVARKLCELRQSVLVLGSATPSIESYHRAESQSELLTLPQRVNQAPLPEVTLVDLREEFQSGNRRTISAPLAAAIEQNLANKRQTILFLNRRGRSTYVFCRECGHVLTCPNCELPYTFHLYSPQTQANVPRLACHHCETSLQPPEICPGCGGTKIKFFGAGTQKVHEDISALFPHARILRMDTDTTGHKDIFSEMHAALTERKVDILIGTQMVAKGWDLPEVSLIGVILADQSLYFPDFRAGERTFQLLTQVAGRAGRRDHPGQVFIQTYDPDNPYLIAASQHDYASYYALELRQREKYHYPPFTSLTKLTYADHNPAQALSEATALMAQLKNAQIIQREQGESTLSPLEIIGPIPAFIPKRQNQYYYHLILKGQNPQPLLQYVPEDWTIDVDPLDLL